MLCPACGNILQKLSVTTKQGGRFEVDHCGRCGGTWFDPYEINRIPYHEVMALSQLTVLPKKNINQNIYYFKKGRVRLNKRWNVIIDSTIFKG